MFFAQYRLQILSDKSMIHLHLNVTKTLLIFASKYFPEASQRLLQKCYNLLQNYINTVENYCQPLYVKLFINFFVIGKKYMKYFLFYCIYL